MADYYNGDGTYNYGQLTEDVYAGKYGPINTQKQPTTTITGSGSGSNSSSSSKGRGGSKPRVQLGTRRTSTPSTKTMVDSAGSSENSMDTQSMYDTMLERQDEQIERDAEEAKLDREAAARRDAILAKSQYNSDLLNWATEDNKRKRREQLYGASDPDYVDYAGILDKPVDPTSGSGLGFNSDAFGSSGSSASSALNQPFGGINNQNKVFPDPPSWLSGPTPRERYAAQDKEKFSPKVDNRILGLNRVASVSNKENYDL